MKLYFTFGNNPKFPYQDGWVEVEAEDAHEALEIYSKKYPNPENPEVVNCAFVYTEQEFKNSIAYVAGNYGAFCHEVIKG